MILNDRSLKVLALRLLLPGLLLNITVGNQLWMLGPIYVGQLVYWPLIACAAFVLLGSYPRRLWPVILVATVFATRALGLQAAGSWQYFLYAVPVSGLFLLTGSIAAAERSDLVYRQLRFYFVLTVPFMVLQVAGAGDWTLALNTETTAVSLEKIESARSVAPTLFVPASEAHHAIGQGRPAGFMHANNILSLAIVFGLALQFGRIRSAKVTWTDALFCAALVLSMAKIAILSFLVMVIWLLVSGPAMVRQRIGGVLLLTVFLYGVYAFFFPGVFAIELSLYKIGYSVFVRLNDFVAVMDPEAPMWQAAALALEGTSQLRYGAAEDVGTLSGYAAIAGALPYLAPAALLGLVLFRRGLQVVKAHSAVAARIATLVLITIVLYPLAVPIWAAPSFWFMAGFAFLPVLVALQRRTGALTAGVPNEQAAAYASPIHA